MINDREEDRNRNRLEEWICSIAFFFSKTENLSPWNGKKNNMVGIYLFERSENKLENLLDP